MVNLTCAWCFIANMTILNIEWPDGNSQYYGTVVNTTNLKINGTFPNSRYFSYELYSLDTWEPFWDIHDNEIKVKDFVNPNGEKIPYFSEDEVDFTQILSPKDELQNIEKYAEYYSRSFYSPKINYINYYRGF